MDYEITFSHRFEISDTSRCINDCCFAGDLVTERLLPLVRVGFDDVQTNQEDWGWFIWCYRRNLRVYCDVHCSDLDAGAFTIHIGARRKRWLGLVDEPVDVPDAERTRDAVVAELAAWLGVHPEVRRLEPWERSV